MAEVEPIIEDKPQQPKVQVSLRYDYFHFSHILPFGINWIFNSIQFFNFRIFNP